MEDSVYRFGEFSMSPAERRLSHGVKSVALAPQAFDAMCLLIRNHGGLVPKSEFMRTLWPGIHVSDANLTNIIVQLRKLIGRESIQTVSKHGYRFTLPVAGEPGINQATYATFVRGRELMAERSVESIVRARDLFTICVADDPQFATGWAWLGRTCRTLEKFKGNQPSALNVADAAFRRAFAIDPDSATAHNFYTQLQVDLGHGREAMRRLATRIKLHGEDPDSLTGLVQVLRCCGLLDESVAAHDRAKAIDPTVKTSVAHTVFLLGDYASVFETYVGKGFYLDAAAWAALGQTDRAATLLRARIKQPEIGPFMSAMMESMLAALEQRGEEAARFAEKAELVREPEGLFYFARHMGIVNDPTAATDLVRRAREAGFWSSYALEHDGAFAGVRNAAAFQMEVRSARELEVQSRQALLEALGYALI